MSNRPTQLRKGNTLYWVINIYDSNGQLINADSTPSISVRKNGAADSTSVTISKRASTTGIYDCSAAPASTSSGDQFHFEEEASISGDTFVNTWSCVISPMLDKPEVSSSVWDVPTSSYLGAGTFGLRFAALNTTSPDNTSITAIKTVTDQMVFTVANELDCNAVSGGGGGDATAANQTAISNAISSLNDFNPASDTVITDTTSRNASKADVSSLATSTEVTSVGSAVNGNSSAIGVVDTVVDAIKAVTDNLPNSGALSDLATASSISALNNFDPATDTVITDAASRTASQADVSLLATAASISALNDFDPSVDVVSSVTTVGSVTSAVTTANAQDVSDILNSIPSNWDTMDIDASTGAVASQLTNEAIYLYFVSGNREDQFKADVSALATSTALATVDTVVDSIKVTTDKIDTALVLDGSVYQYTVNALENAPSGGGGGGDATAANQTTIINAISNLNDFDPSSEAVANVTLVATTTTNTDMRGTDSANTVAPDNAGIAANGVAIAALNDTTPQEFWDSLTTGSYVSGSFGERLLVSQGTHRTLQVTGSHHVAADVHEFQNDSITAAAIATDAVTELQTGLVTVGTAFTYTNGAGDTHSVTIS